MNNAIAYKQFVTVRAPSFTIILCSCGYKTPGRPSMDILVKSWQDLAKILEKF